MKTKKIVSLLLAVLMACSVFAGLSVVSADEVTTHTYTVVGDAAFLGAAWAPETVADDMALQADGTYKITYENVAKADCYTVKVAEDHSWGNSFGAEVATGADDPANIEFSVPADGATVDIILTITGTREKDGVTLNAGTVQVLVNGTPAPGKVLPTEETHYVAGQGGLCNGIDWNQAAPENMMTKNADGSFEITFTGVNPKEAPLYEGDTMTWQFKVTSDGVWEPAYGYNGMIAPGEANVEVPVTEANSTVKIVLSADKFVKAYVNGVDVSPEPVTTEATKSTETTNDKGETSAVTSAGGYYAPATGTESKRFFFEMPTEWYTFSNACPVAYWWDGADKPLDWQHSYMLRPAFVKGPNGGDIFYIDVPTDVPTIIFGNGIDGGSKPAEGEEPGPNWGKNYQTINIGAEYYDKGESQTYPDGTSTFDNMVFVVDPEQKSVSDFSGATTYGGEWFYVHADGTVDTKDNKDEPKLEIKGVQVSLDKNAAEVQVGKTAELKATIANADPSQVAPTLTWMSSDTSVVTVENGVVKGVKEGTANVTVTVAQGEATFSATATITVVPAVVKVASVKVSKSSVSIYNGKTVKLTATVSPSNATNKAVTWTSSNAKIAKVDSKGTVTGIKPGKVTIKATAKDGSKKYGSCTVTVKQQKATKLTLSKKSVSLKKKGASVSVKATLAPSNVYNKKISVKTSNKKIAKISAKSINSKKSVKITAVKKGSAKITFTAADGSKKKAVCKVTVKK